MLAILILVAYYFISQDKDVAYSAPEWSCEYINKKWECSVSLEIANKTRTHQSRKISIRGVIIPSDTKHSSLKMCGEKLLNIEMAPHEKLNIKETIEMDKKPNKNQYKRL